MRYCFLTVILVKLLYLAHYLYDSFLKSYQVQKVNMKKITVSAISNRMKMFKNLTVLCDVIDMAYGSALAQTLES